MDIADLRYFEAVAAHGAINRAAAALNTVQSNVTARIKGLEAELGCTLFERHSRGVTLTPAGKRLLPYSRRAAGLLSDAVRATRDAGEPKGALTIGSLESTAALRLAPVISTYISTFTEVDFTLATGTHGEMLDAVLARDLDGAFVCGPVDHGDLATEPVFREELAIFAAPGVTSFADLCDAGTMRIIVLRSSCAYRQRLERVLEKRGIAAPRVIELGTLEAVFQLVSAGLGVTMLPRALVEGVWDVGSVSLHPLPRADARVETLFVRRRDAFASSALEAFLDQARKTTASRTAA